jgi:spermidine/putrescine transport system permease protein
LLAFSLSFDDFIITYFNAGSNFQTFPVFVWTSNQRGIPPQANVIASLMFFVALIAVITAQVSATRRAKALAK